MQVLPSFGSAKVVTPALSPSTSSIHSLSLSSLGDFLLSCSDDDSLRVFSVDKAQEIKFILSKQRGVSLGSYTHSDHSVLYASPRQFTLHYLSLHDERHLRHFHGHAQRVNSLSMNPIDDSFLSCGEDDKAFLWDLRMASPTSSVSIPHQDAHDRLMLASTIGTYDPQGLIFAIATHANAIRLYDVRSTQNGPFTTFLLDRTKLNGDTLSRSPARAAVQTSKSPLSESFLRITYIKFSPEGQSMLLGTNTSVAVLVDSYDGRVKKVFSSIPNNTKTVVDACFSPNGQFVLAGGDEGSVHLLDCSSKHENGNVPIAIWQPHTKPVRALVFSHSRACFVSAAHELSFFLPRQNSDN